MEPAPSPSLGLLDGGYRLLERLGAGGSAEVHRAERLADGVEVAVKMLHGDHLASPEALTLFEDEARLLGRLRHPRIVRMLDFGLLAGRPAIVMDFVRGCSLSGLLASARRRQVQLAPALALLVGSAVCEALDYAHRLTDEAGRPLRLVHRDVSPANVLLSTEGDVLLSDFGIAKWALRAAPTTQVEAVKGNWFYLSPEQADGLPLDPRSDLFSLGVVLFRMLGGQLPFEAEVPEVALDLIRRCRFRSLAELAPDVPRQLVALVERLLSRDPAARFPDARTLRDELARRLGPPEPAAAALAAEARATLAAPAPRLSLAARPGAEPPTRALRPAGPAAPARRAAGARLLALILGGAMVATAAVVGGRLVRSAPPAPAAPAKGTPSAASAKSAPSAAPPSVEGAAPPRAADSPAARSAEGATEQRAAEGAVEQRAVEGAVEQRAVEGAAAAAPSRAATAASAHKAHAPASRAGYLDIDSSPWSSVALDGHPIGTTPLRHRPVGAGAHVITLRNDQLGLERRIDVKVAPGATAHRFVNLVTDAVRR
jgi:serine/threonine-protein kinase